jgi:iron uptake system component EfeO
VIRRRILRRRGALAALGCLLAAMVAVAGVLAAGVFPAPPGATAIADGLPHTAVQVSLGGCGQGWSHPHGGSQVFDLRNVTDAPAEVDLVDARAPAVYGQAAVYGEVEGLAPGTSRPLRVTLGNGAYAFRCVPEDADAITGPTVRVTGAHTASGPAVLPVTEQDLIASALRYQRWIATRMDELAAGVSTLKDAIDRGDLGAARAAWLPAHLVYERMGAAYGTFGDADKAINGTTAGLGAGAVDSGFTGFHRIEYGLWHGRRADLLRGPADQLAKDVATLRERWSQARIDPAALGLRAHEILENTLQFELTGRTDYGSGSNLATARANLDGTRAVLDSLRPLLTSRLPGLPRVDASLDRLQHTLDGFDHGSTWTPLNQLARSQREQLDAGLGDAVEQLAQVAAVCEPRRTS